MIARAPRDDGGARRQVPLVGGDEAGRADDGADEPADGQAWAHADDEQGRDRRGHHEVREDQQHPRQAHGAGDDERERGVEERVPGDDAQAGRVGRRERDRQQRPAGEGVDEPDRRVEPGQPRHVAGRHGEDRADQQLLDALGALRRAIHHEHGERGRDRVDDADDRLLRERTLPHGRHREEQAAADGERQRVPVGGGAARRVTGQQRDRDAERGDLGQREVDEDHAAREHVQAEVGVDAGQHEARQERQREQIDHGSVSALASRATSRSNSVR